MPRLIEGIVCSLKWAKNLEEVGIRQDTLFHWVRLCNGEFVVFGQAQETLGHLVRYAAYTAQEFVDLFPVLFKISRKENEWQFLSKEFHMHLKDEENLANVLARILLRLLKTDPQLLKIPNEETVHAMQDADDRRTIPAINWKKDYNE